MSQTNPSRIPSAAYGLAGLMGCFIAVFALVTILVGLLIDRALNSDRRFATLACVLAGLPLNLFFALWLTRRILSRVLSKQQPAQGTAENAESLGKPAQSGDNSTQ